MTKPLALVGGYLGTGKTTFINSVLTTPDVPPVALVVNDFGSVDIDASLVVGGDDTVLRLANGCICCQITDDVQRTMSAVAARTDVALVLCELSGIADPRGMSSWRTFPGLTAGPTLVCVDVEETPRRLHDEYVRDVVTAQIAAADVLLLTKTDRAPEWLLARTVEECRRLNPAAVVLDRTDPRSMRIETLTGIPVESRPHSGPETHSGLETHSTAEVTAGTADEVVTATDHESRTLVLRRPTDIDALVSVLGACVDSLERAKTIVDLEDGTYAAVHVAGRRVTIDDVRTPRDRNTLGRLVLIAGGAGAGVRLDAVERTLDDHALLDHAFAPPAPAVHRPATTPVRE